MLNETVRADVVYRFRMCLIRLALEWMVWVQIQPLTSFPVVTLTPCFLFYSLSFKKRKKHTKSAKITFENHFNPLY